MRAIANSGSSSQLMPFPAKNKWESAVLSSSSTTIPKSQACGIPSLARNQPNLNLSFTRSQYPLRLVAFLVNNYPEQNPMYPVWQVTQCRGCLSTGSPAQSPESLQYSAQGLIKMSRWRMKFSLSML